jgi:hypothetical protein
MVQPLVDPALPRRSGDAVAPADRYGLPGAAAAFDASSAALGAAPSRAADDEPDTTRTG